MSISYGKYIKGEKTSQWIPQKQGVTITIQDITERHGERGIPGISHFLDGRVMERHGQKYLQFRIAVYQTLIKK